MQCFFCPNPAAHPATGCEYSRNVLARNECVVRFWKWFESHSHPRTGRDKRGRLRCDFYAAAAKYPPTTPSSPPPFIEYKANLEDLPLSPYRITAEMLPAFLEGLRKRAASIDMKKWKGE